MSKKNLNTDALMNELRGGSSFFPTKQEEFTPSSPVIEKNEEKQITTSSPVEKKGKKEYHDTMIPSNHDTMIPSNHDTIEREKSTSLEEVIRKAVKQIGKDAATYRFTEEEKRALDDIEYSYKRQGIRTSGNEITRIGLNFIIEDYSRNGENSILAKVLKILNS